MADGNPRSTAQIAGHPIHPMPIPFPIALLVATFASGLAFWRTGNALWATASIWLLGAALVGANPANSQPYCLNRPTTCSLLAL